MRSAFDILAAVLVIMAGPSQPALAQYPGAAEARGRCEAFRSRSTGWIGRPIGEARARLRAPAGVMLRFVPPEAMRLNYIPSRLTFIAGRGSRVVSLRCG
jgi:hypothetical protein